MKNFIRKFIPKRVWLPIHKLVEMKTLKKEYKIDMRKYKANSFFFSNSKTKRHLEGDLIFYYHKFEKGLTLPYPRVGFGKGNIKYLLDAINNYVKHYGWEEIAVISLNTLFTYYTFNKKNGLDMKDLQKEISKLKSTIPKDQTNKKGGIVEVSKKEIEQTLFDFESFAYSRYSHRNFTDESVEINQIKKAVKMALKTPSVCNRQPSKVYVLEKEEKSKVLKYQNGNAGFGDSADKVLIVTTDLMDFRGVNERNQAYIEGGLFSMSLMYGLHSIGLGTCPLNLSILNKEEYKLKSSINIPSSEIPIMMIAVGHIPENTKVAYSSRRNLEETIVI